MSIQKLTTKQAGSLCLNNNSIKNIADTFFYLIIEIKIYKNWTNKSADGLDGDQKLNLILPHQSVVNPQN